MNHEAVAHTYPDFEVALTMFTRASQPLDRILTMWNWTTGDLVRASVGR